MRIDKISNTERELLFSLKTEILKAQQTFEQDQDSLTENTIQQLEIFRPYRSVQVLYTCLGYIVPGIGDDEANELLERFIMCLGRLDA